MSSVLLYAVLGLGAGAMYGMGSLSLVMVYRASGVVNFATGAIGMVGAMVFYHSRDSGMPVALALVLAFALGAAINVTYYLVVARRLRGAQPLIQLTASLALFVVVYAWASSKWASSPLVPTPLLPTDRVGLWGNAGIGEDRLILLGIGVGLTAILAPVYRYTRFGHRTAAVAENVAATHGVSSVVVATVNWALGGVLAVLTAVLIVNVVGLSVSQLALIVVPCLVAAVVGGFRSFGLALAGGLVIGILESEFVYLQASHPSWPIGGLQSLVSVIVVIVALLIRGAVVSTRGDQEATKLPELTDGKIRPVTISVSAVVAILLVLTVSSAALGALATSACLAIICLSVVVVSGYAGQISLTQVGLAGLAGWVGAKIVIAGGGFIGGFALGILAVVALGVVVALPAVRVKGMNLAIVTLTMAVFIENQFLNNSSLGGGQAGGMTIGTFEIFGLNLNQLEHPARYAIVCLAVLAVAALAVLNLRRGRAGRRLMAVRTNERAAAALGVSVVQAKVYAFALAAALAGVGGLLMTFGAAVVQFEPNFGFFQSIAIVLYTVIGGIGYVAGAIIGGLIDPTGLVPYSIRGAIGSSTTIQIILGLVLLVQLSYLPSGSAAAWVEFKARLARSGPGPLRAWLRRSPSAEPAGGQAVAAPEPVAPGELELKGVSIAFGGVKANVDVSLSVAAGNVVGLIGPNGAGKTTLIDGATGFVKCQSGAVLLNGRDVTDWPTSRRAQAGLGRSFQSLELFDSMTVSDNILTACEPRDVKAYFGDLVMPRRSALPPVARAAIEEFGLTAELDRKAGDLSFGRRRLVAIARAVAARPSVLMLDEPAAGLDENETAELGRMVRKLADDWNMAILLVEHDVGLVMDVCDSIVVLESGQVLASGTPDEVRHDERVLDAYFGHATDEKPAVAAVERRVAPTPVAPAEPYLEARGLVAGYGDLPAVRDVSLSVARGEVVLLIGPNGAGKSTTLKAMTGAIRPFSGEVCWQGSPTQAPLHRRVSNGLAYVPEERNIVASLPVDAHFNLGPGERDIAYGYFPRLSQLARRRAGLLSGGERQMLVLGAALALKPEVIVIDELSLGLAPIVVEGLLETIREVADSGVGVLLVDQHISSALAIADRAYVLSRGSVVFSGSAEQATAALDQIEDVFVGASGHRLPIVATQQTK